MRGRAASGSAASSSNRRPSPSATSTASATWPASTSRSSRNSAKHSPGLRPGSERPMPHEIVTFGEAMIRLSPPNFRRLEQTDSLEVQVGGAELNTAVALARLGRRSAWVSRLTDNPLGRLIANRAREAGVSTEHVVWTKDDRGGVYLREFGAA